MIVLIYGMPCAGKSTQAELLADHLNVPHISAGGMLREEIATGSARGAEIAGMIRRAELVPGPTVCGLLQPRLQQRDCRRGFVLEGYPRNTDQAVLLDAMFAGMDLHIDHVLKIDADPAQIEPRMRARAEQDTGRTDDDIAILQARLRTYRAETAPMDGYYADRLVRVNGAVAAGEVAANIREGLGL